jgi:hypothetical protein
LLQHEQEKEHKKQDEKRWSEVNDLKEVDLQETVKYFLWKLTQNNPAKETTAGDTEECTSVIRNWCHSAI